MPQNKYRIYELSARSVMSYAMKAFFEKIDWDKVDSNLERLPYLALQLGKHTPAIKSKPAKGSELFTFAQEPDWKDRLDQEILKRVSALLSNYEACLSRIRACRYVA